MLPGIPEQQLRALESIEALLQEQVLLLQQLVLLLEPSYQQPTGISVQKKP